MTPLKKGHLAQKLTSCHTAMTSSDPCFSGHIEFFQGSLEYDSEGIFQTAYVVSRDITERKRAQERELELKLERERRKLLVTFFENAAHEFRTPLTTISTSAYLMARSNDPECRLHKEEEIGVHIKRITKLVDSLLLMTRLESNGKMARKPVDLREVLQSMCAKAEETCTGNHDLRCDVEADLSLVLGDVDYLGYAFQQILDNACRFTLDGGKIDVKAKKAEQQIWIEIYDGGSGIPQESLPHIFETFWRKDTTHTTPGFGLGLPIAQKIIERHGGEIFIESEEGQGTMVRVSLPVN